MKEHVMVLDFGGQYTQLIAKAVRSLGIYSEIHPHSLAASAIAAKNPAALIFSGGPESTCAKNAPQIDPQILHLNIPILGICYGMQLMQKFFGGTVSKSLTGEYGKVPISVDHSHPLFAGIPAKTLSWMSHSDCIEEAAEGFDAISKTEKYVAAMKNDEKKLYGVQFHPEVTHMQEGKKILGNFLREIALCKSRYSPKDIVSSAKRLIQKEAKGKNILCFVSGGVDSAYVAALLREEKNVYPIYIEALMRKGETEEVKRALLEAGVDLRIVYAEDRFIAALSGISDPEEKRKIIGNLFGELQREILEELGLPEENTLLAQGTLYTDIIESGKGLAHTIKSHHNVGCAFIENLKKKNLVLEPSRWIFKDEVRLAAKEVGLPDEIAHRQPFPGPGLAIRIVDATPLGKDPAIEVKDGMEAFYLPVKTVGVQGDARTYKHPILLRGKNSWEEILEVKEELKGCTNRVLYSLSEKPFAGKSVPCKITKQNVRLLQEIDAFLRAFLKDEEIAQTITVLFGADPFGTNLPSVALRAVLSEDFMTVSPVLFSFEMLKDLEKQIHQKFAVGAFVIDITEKPPATTEWE